MRINKRKVIAIVITIISICLIGLNSYAHSGKTDSNGGHKDNKNKSGLGSYHYHCGGHPAHLHPNGVCPYSSASTVSGSSNSSSKSKTTIEVSTIDVTQIQINENIESIEVGKSRKLTATIIPSNATDKSITWKSSDESIAKVSSNGEVVAIKPGLVAITASSANGNSNTIQINIKENKNYTTLKTSSSNTNINNSGNKEDSNAIGGFLALSLIGGGGYLGYKKLKKS